MSLPMIPGHGDTKSAEYYKKRDKEYRADKLLNPFRDNLASVFHRFAPLGILFLVKLFPPVA